MPEYFGPILLQRLRMRSSAISRPAAARRTTRIFVFSVCDFWWKGIFDWHPVRKVRPFFVSDACSVNLDIEGIVLRFLDEVAPPEGNRFVTRNLHPISNRLSSADLTPICHVEAPTLVAGQTPAQTAGVLEDATGLLEKSRPVLDTGPHCVYELNAAGEGSRRAV